MKRKNIIKIMLIAAFLFLSITFFSQVRAAGVNGTTIVLNPRAWRRMDRLC